jgi:predicted outer membrane repeat protein
VYVIQGGGGQFTTITEALLYAPDGAYISVWPGTYSASTGETMPLQMRSGVTLRTHHEGLGSVIIDGEGLTRCIEVVNPNYATKIENLIFQNGAAITGSEHGGGMWIGGFEGVPSPPPTIRNCIFRNNHANRFGGGVYADESARHALLTGCRFTNNTAANGGGVYSVGYDPIGMVWNVYDGNSVTGYGGGLYVQNPASARGPSRAYSMFRLTFAENSAGLGGSAIYTDSSIHYLTDVIIAFHSSLNDPIVCRDGTYVLTECCDVFGNAGGDYVGCLAGQLTNYGNIWNNPEFCGVGFEPDDPYSISVNSACAEHNNAICGQIGSRPPKCGIPYLHFNLEWLEYYIPFGEEFCQNLIFQNGGDLALDWQLFAYEGVFERGFGGPDAFGYRWGDSDKPDGPSFEWNDISGYGTQVTLGNDDATLVVLPFDFPFYDTSWFEFALSSNGYLTFGSDWTASVNGPIPDSSQPNEFIAPFWEDLDPSAGGTIHYHYSPDAGTFTVQFTEVPNASSAVGGEYTFQVVLHEDGTIRFYYLSMVGYVEGATIGIENPDGTIGLQVAYNEPYMHDDLAVIIDLGPPPPDWLWMSLTEGTLSPGEEAVCECCVETSDLEAGIYEATLVMVSDDFNDPVRYIPLTMEVFPTGVDDEMSTRLTLRGNYPNPFNPRTSIAFDLPEPARVSLRVYNSAGRMVRSLLEGIPMEAGPSVQSWDGRDSDGTALASGVYFCMLEVDGVSLSGKMVLLK